MSMLQDKLWLEAYDFFRAFSSHQAAQNSTVHQAALAYARLCQVKLGMSLPLTSQHAHDTVTSMHPFPIVHLAKALSLDAQASSTLSETGLSTTQQNLHAQAVGQALAFILHPDVAAIQVPMHLINEVQQVLIRRAVAITLSVDDRESKDLDESVDVSELTRWRKTATGSASLTKLLEMSCLDAIKRQMFKLYNQVGT